MRAPTCDAYCDPPPTHTHTHTRHCDASADGEQSHWDVFFRKIEPIAASIPYIAIRGNHELWANFLAFHARFTMPSANRSATDILPGGAPGGAPYYALDIGQYLHLAMTNTETVIDTADIEPLEAAWLDADLAASVAAGDRWRVVTGHRPFYCSNRNQVRQIRLHAIAPHQQIRRPLYSRSRFKSCTNHPTQSHAE